MKRALHYFACVVLSILCFTTFALSQRDSTQGGPPQGGAPQGGSGRIQGRITDEKGDPVPFANIVVQNSRMGAASDATGQFVMANVPAGTYTLVASSVGFRNRSASVTVAEGQTVTRNFGMTSDALNLSEVVTTGSY